MMATARPIWWCRRCSDALEGQRLIYTPLWVRVLALGSLLVALFVSAVVVVIYINSDRDTWVLAALSVTQVAASGLFVSFLLLFSARDTGVPGLRLKTARMLRKSVPEALSFIGHDQPLAMDWHSLGVSQNAIKEAKRRVRTDVKVAHLMGTHRALYRLEGEGRGLHLMVQVNVWEMTVSYYFPAHSSDELEALRPKLDWALARFIDTVGYTASWYFSTEAFDGRTYASVHLTKAYEKGFLDQDYDKLFFLQDLAASTQSLLKECAIQEIAVSYDTLPSTGV